jgi:hypothetical protein
MGTSDELALDILINTLIGFSRDLAGLRRVVVGGVNSDWPVPSLPEDDDSEGQVRTCDAVRYLKGVYALSGYMVLKPASLLTV